MKLCDRCFPKGDCKPSTKSLTTSTQETFDLCETCFEDFRNFIAEKPETVKKQAKSGKNKK